jgi:hypothetical protein
LVAVEEVRQNWNVPPMSERERRDWVTSALRADLRRDE